MGCHFLPTRRPKKTPKRVDLINFLLSLRLSGCCFILFFTLKVEQRSILTSCFFSECAYHFAYYLERGENVILGIFPGSPGVGTLLSKGMVGAGEGVPFLLGKLGSYGPHQLKDRNIKQKQYCNKFNKDFTNGPHQKKNLQKKAIVFIKCFLLWSERLRK